jgi:hypothetical protein
MANTFGKVFMRLLETPEEVEQDMTDLDAMQSTLDPGSSTNDFDVSAPAARATQAIADASAHMVGELDSWINRLSDFSNFLNGTDNKSMQSKLKNAIPDTLFDKIRIAENKKIARVAMEIVSLNEMLKGYRAASGDAKLKLV